MKQKTSNKQTNRGAKQTQEETTAELGLLRGEFNKQVTKILEVQKSMTLKIAAKSASHYCLLYTSLGTGSGV